MMGGGGRRTGAGARRLSTENERNTLRGLLGTNGDAGGWTVVSIADAAAAAAAGLSVTTAGGDEEEGDVTVSG